MSFQLELKLQHYISPKMSPWLIIPWEPGTDAAHGVPDRTPGTNSPLWIHWWGDGPRATLGQPSNLPPSGGPLGPPAFGVMSPSSHPHTPWGHHRAAPAADFSCGQRSWDLLELAGQGGRCYSYFRTDPCTRQPLQSRSL